MNKIVRDNFALAKIAYSRFDVPTRERTREHYQPLIDILAEDVRHYVTAPADLPNFQAIRGKQAVANMFLAEFEEHVKYGVIEMGPREYFNFDDCVVAKGTVSYNVNTGFFVRDLPFVNFWDIRDGLITRIISVEDCRVYEYATRGLGPTGGVM